MSQISFLFKPPLLFVVRRLNLAEIFVGFSEEVFILRLGLDLTKKWFSIFV